MGTAGSTSFASTESQGNRVVLWERFSMPDLDLAKTGSALTQKLYPSVLTTIPTTSWTSTGSRPPDRTTTTAGSGQAGRLSLSFISPDQYNATIYMSTNWALFSNLLALRQNMIL